MTTQRIIFDAGTRQIHVYTRKGGGRRAQQTLRFDQPGDLLAESYRHAIVRRDRLQSIWLARLLTPQASLEEANACVRRDWPSA